MAALADLGVCYPYSFDGCAVFTIGCFWALVVVGAVADDLTSTLTWTFAYTMPGAWPRRSGSDIPWLSLQAQEAVVMVKIPL